MNTKFLNSNHKLAEVVNKMFVAVLGDHQAGNYRIHLDNTDYDENGGVCPCFVFVEKAEDEYIVSELTIMSKVQMQSGEHKLVEWDKFDFVSGEGYVNRDFFFSVRDEDDFEAAEFNMLNTACYFDMEFYNRIVVDPLTDRDSSKAA